MQGCRFEDYCLDEWPMTKCHNPAHHMAAVDMGSGCPVLAEIKEVLNLTRRKEGTGNGRQGKGQEG